MAYWCDGMGCWRLIYGKKDEGGQAWDALIQSNLFSRRSKRENDDISTKSWPNDMNRSSNWSSDWEEYAPKKARDPLQKRVGKSLISAKGGGEDDADQWGSPFFQCYNTCSSSWYHDSSCNGPLSAMWSMGYTQSMRRCRFLAESWRSGLWRLHHGCESVKNGEWNVVCPASKHKA